MGWTLGAHHPTPHHRLTTVIMTLKLYANVSCPFARRGMLAARFKAVATEDIDSPQWPPRGDEKGRHEAPVETPVREQDVC